MPMLNILLNNSSTSDRKKMKLEGLVTLSQWLVTETLIKPDYGEVAGSIPMTTEIKRILLRTLQPIA